MSKIIKKRRSFWTNHRWFSLGIHVDLDKKYMDFHFGKHVATFGNNKIPDYPPDVKAQMECYWKEYCKKCNELTKKCSMGCHPQHSYSNGTQSS